MVVAIDDMGIGGIALMVKIDALDVITGNHEPTAAQLNAVGGAGGVPGPGRRFDVSGDFAWWRPSRTVVIAKGEPNGARRFALDNQPFIAVGQILAKEEPELAGGAIQYRAGVTTGHARPCGDNLQRLPGDAVVKTAFEQQSDDAGIAAAIFASFGKGQQHAPRRNRQGRNAEGMVAFLPTDKEIALGQMRSSAGGVMSHHALLPRTGQVIRLLPSDGTYM